MLGESARSGGRARVAFGAQRPGGVAREQGQRQRARKADRYVERAGFERLALADRSFLQPFADTRGRIARDAHASLPVVA